MNKLYYISPDESYIAIQILDSEDKIVGEFSIEWTDLGLYKAPQLVVLSDAFKALWMSRVYDILKEYNNLNISIKDLASILEKNGYRNMDKMV